ncbi:sulfite exporter TauE/SafE family protein [Paenibacillus senegalimassiliensis]|uniref:sulfite exporter TauE/SafE family protein n=1 Tax=Paenibacillus senegalimassiliensis TaxID=1737426 RepID=UPI0009EAAD3A|nr:sulfite exporter TauE/SafE family protein [Paenibacillus senegalimassiliensis]
MITLLYGFLIGIFVTLIGGGGASLYLGVLTSQLGLPVSIAAPTSLFIALPALFSGFLTQIRVRNVRFSIGNKLIISAIPGILIGTFTSKYISLTIYNWIVGLILIVMGCVVLKKHFWKKQNTKNPEERPLQSILLGLLSGLMVGIGGLSGGATTVGGLTILGLSSLQAAGTSTYVLWVMSLIGFISHLFTSQIAWSAGIYLMIGAVIGSVLTPLVLRKFNYKKLNKVLTPFMGIIIIYFGIKMFF